MVGSDAVLIGDYPSPRTYGASRSSSKPSSCARAVPALPGHPEDDIVPAQRPAYRPRPTAGRLGDVVVFDAKMVKAPRRGRSQQFLIGSTT
jgi:hypothetical protein